MALGGGTFTLQNKVLAGSYINFISLARAGSSLGDRGYVALPYTADWGEANTVVKVTNEQFTKETEKYFGYSYDNDKVKNFRELFKHAKTVYLYRMVNNGVKASNTYATAKYEGVRGNDIKIIISTNVDDTSRFDVKTVVSNSVREVQTVATASELQDNIYVTFKKDATLSLNAGLPLENGSNGDAVTGTEWTDALNALESEYFNVLICNSTVDNIKALCVNYVKRLREEVGAKCQVVVCKYESANYEGVISVENKLQNETDSNAELVYWVGGVQASCEINKSCTNKIYDGELLIDTKYTQLDLEDALKAGKFIFHTVGDDVRVLEDVNTLTTFTTEKNDDFRYNQTIRVLDQVANDIAKIFNTRFIGQIPNDNGGRVSLWNEIVKHHKELEDIRAIENFNAEDVTVEQGETKKSVVVNDKITVVNAMAQLYMTVVVA